MKFAVSEVEQYSSGGSYVVKYEAEVELLAIGDGISVEVLSTYPADPDAHLVEIAKQYIRRGAESVLGTRGAVLRLSRLCIHASDFKGWRFEQFTAHGLRKAIGADEPVEQNPDSQ